MNLPKKVRTYRDALVRSQQSSFVGREKQLSRFRRSLELAVRDELDRPIFNVSGLGGVGKSTLLRQFRQITHDLSGATAAIDETERSVPDVMGRLAEELEQQGHRLTQFSERYKVYRQRRQELESDPEAPQGFSAFLGRSAVKLARRVPGAGVVFDFVDEEIVAEHAGEWASYVARKLTNKDEVRLVQEPLEVLTPLFLQEIGKLAEKSALTLCFDTYERTGDFLDSWLQDLINGRYGDLSLRVLIVIAGREALDKNQWALYEGLIVRFPLSPFTDEEARQHLAQKGITDHDIIHIILKLSGHLPLLVATLAAEIPDDPGQVGEPNDTAIERFLKWVDDPKRRQVAIDAALPQCLNRDILALLNGEAEAEELFEWLKQMPFVKEQDDGWVYHEVVRTQMLRHKRRSSPQQWAEVHSKLADYYDTLLNALQLEEAEQQKDATWQNYSLNVLYHRLCQAPQPNLSIALNEFLAALRSQHTFAQRWAAIIAGAGRDTGTTEVQQWGENLVDGLRAIDEKCYDVAIATLTQLLNYPKLEARWRPSALFQRGLFYYLANQYLQALEDLTEASKIAPEESKHWGLRGETYRLMERYEEALNDFNCAIKINQNATPAITGRGAIYRSMKRYNEALDDFNRAVELDPKAKWSIANRGITYREMNCYDEALNDFNNAIELDPEYAWAIAQRGITYREIKHYEEAIDDFDRAIELSPDYAWAIAYRGHTYQEMECYDEALVNFNRAVELDPNYAWVIAQRGKTYRLLEHYEDALKDFDRVVELGSDYAWAINERGEIYRLLGHYDEALDNFARAIELEPKWAWAIVNRGATYQEMKRYAEALDDLNYAIELCPEDARAFIVRGQIYHETNCYAEALNDFTRVIEFDSDNHWVIALRGETYRLSERYEEALQDFNRAIEFDPDYAWAIASRGQIHLEIECYDEALTDFNHAVALDPSYVWAIAWRGETYRLLGSYAEALNDFNRVIEFNLDCAWAIAWRGETYRLLERYDEALKDFDRAIELNPDYVWAINERGELYLALQRYSDALTDFDRIIALDPNDAWAFANRGRTYYLMQCYNEALNDLNRAIELFPKLAWAIAGRGVIYLILRRYEDALTELSLAVELDSSNDCYVQSRAMAYKALSQADKARTDLDFAIRLAQENYAKDPEDWNNTFNLALYYLIAEQPEQARHFYRDALDKGASLRFIYESIHDLDLLLTIFPEHRLAKSARGFLQKQLEHRSNL